MWRSVRYRVQESNVEARCGGCGEVWHGEEYGVERRVRAGVG